MSLGAVVKARTPPAFREVSCVEQDNVISFFDRTARNLKSKVTR